MSSGRSLSAHNVNRRDVGAGERMSTGLTTHIDPRRRPIAWLLDRVLAGYQRVISPLLPPACRFTPSCSAYARESLRHHTAPAALRLILWRVLRCQPLCAGGVDPVPRGRLSACPGHEAT